MITGKEYGVLRSTREEVVGTNGVYSVIEEVDGQRLITEVCPSESRQILILRFW